ncbi:flavin reductase family protein [Terrabacter sp. BE26]|uniref:flavin reductase family protein n=1 Tax=Terrabacter sp. BE26 TaxID=2898152 RepID=UPI0035BE4380
MTIHTGHPFETPEDDRDQLRRLRGRIGGAVSLWTAGQGIDRAGLTVSSFLVATGDPGRVVGLLHPDSDLLDRLQETGTAVVALLGARDERLADAFAGTMPAPGGPFRLAEWEQTEWGPRAVHAQTWAGVRLDPPSLHEVGWSVFVEASVEHLVVGADDDVLVHRRGRYQRPC